MDGPRPTKDFARTLRSQMSLPEIVLWRALRGGKLNGLKFRRQHPVGRYVLDFYCDARRLAVEVDGADHGAGFQPEKDAARDAWLAERGLSVFRISAASVLGDVGDAVAMIRAYLEIGPPPQG